jgi:hypothetical protein
MAVVRRLDEASVVAALMKEIDLAVFTVNIDQSCHEERFLYHAFQLLLNCNNQWLWYNNAQEFVSVINAPSPLTTSHAVYIMVHEL